MVAVLALSCADDRADCERWCDGRVAEEEMGWCPVAGLDGAGPADCAAVCEDASRSLPVANVESCIVGDPLCFIDLERCVEIEVRAQGCEAACMVRETEHAEDGFCEPGWWLGPDVDCQTACIGAVHDGAEPPAVYQCIESDALCFESLEQCVSAT
jgi:hypothetical protein